jgi:hypothetical protein
LGLHAKNFSATELHDIAAFYSTPLGKKWAMQNSAVADALPQLAVRLLASATVQGALHAGITEIEKRGMTIPKPAVSAQ